MVEHEATLEARPSERASAGSPPAARPHRGERPRRHDGPSLQGAGRINGLDGLRALAVIAVVAYHLWPRAIPGGFLGVDMFFVVSGFLITTLLLREIHDRGKVGLVPFWARRARRLVPALVVVVVVSIVGARLADTDLLVGIGRQVLGALTFSTNWLAIHAGASYFDETAPELFQTFWSLAIEEQFYLVWPLVLVVALVLLKTWRSRARVTALVALGSAVLMAVLYVPGGDPTRVYYGTDTHAFGLLLGAATAFAWAGRENLLPARVRAVWAGPAALVLLGVLVLAMGADETIAYRGGILLGSLLALVAVVACTGPVTAYVRALEVAPLVWVGERSYGIYLWHWPIILILSAAAGEEPGSATWWRIAVASIALTLVLSWASYRWIETPVRRLGFRGAGAVVLHSLRRPVRGPRVGAAVAALLLAAAGVVMVTAPATSQVQQAIEAAQKQIDAQNAGDGGGPEAKPPATPGGKASPETKPSTGAKPSTEAKPQTKPTTGASGSPARPSTAADPSKGAAAPGTAITGDDVIAFGDSVLSAAAPTLYQRFPGIKIDAKPIRKWIDAEAVVAKAAAAGTLRPVVVLNFGTNGGFQFKGSEKSFNAILDAIGPDRQVVLVTINGVSRWVPDANAEAKKLVSDRPNVHVAEWHDYVAQHSGLLHPDRTHPNMKGVGKYADVLRSTLDGITLPTSG